MTFYTIEFDSRVITKRLSISLLVPFWDTSPPLPIPGWLKPPSSPQTRVLSLWSNGKNKKTIWIEMRLYRDFDSIVQELNYLSSSVFLIFLYYRINKKKKKWCIYYWVIISRKKFVINRAFQEFCLICQKDKGKLHKSERLKVCVVKKSRVILLRYSLISKAYEKTMIDFKSKV